MMEADIYKSFGGVSEMLTYLDTFKKKPDEYGSGGDDVDWYASESYDEARERCLAGDTKLSKMLRGSEKLDVSVPCSGTRRKMVTGVVGFMPHVPNYLAGVPNNMVFVKEDRIQKKVLNVYYGCNTHADISADEIARVSARVMSCIMSLERKGYRINLYAVNCAMRYCQKCGFSVKIKDAGQHCDLVKIAFPFLSAAWNRRFAFRFRECVAGWTGGSVGGSVYGETLRTYLQEQHVDYDVALSFYDAQHISTVEQLEKLFEESAKKIKK